MDLFLGFHDQQLGKSISILWPDSGCLWFAVDLLAMNCAIHPLCFCSPVLIYHNTSQSTALSSQKETQTWQQLA